MTKQKPTAIPAAYWKAIMENDASFDDKFFYGVRTTRIFCRPSCSSRIPNKENVLIFKNAYAALDKNFRPCKRCKPDGLNLPAEEWIGQITEWIDEHFTEPVTLERLADISHGSPYHLQRLFKRLKGSSPLEYIQQLRLEKAVWLLEETDYPIAEVGRLAGFPNASYFITLFKKKNGQTPASFRQARKVKKGENMHEPFN
ncbi:bifunctional transcriptional activator/DNA repair enzyme AdaA [Planococcus shenhongbingii]|uniref:Bifunctional transcriptional activator/DNA repair enzyme AdaA n=1 Tax=Planococcus shenhongbingii TaxID=3058398 RepID=A0ABT8NFY5_9BACL|nr:MULTISPECIES: bifunctional transcriptional activator/DNA repair enzyme AdaA [unclassified Planococcus (in: firmicutes)]MDN7246795.1 bifunctional transcriptional activator/DNA repair enzyme AdaA [Planococcus sp. N017]WKA58847.1 bifunctional transcriptional activator/DNA repair enzyme AdaA [Planococcus sp. N016]